MRPWNSPTSPKTPSSSPTKRKKKQTFASKLLSAANCAWLLVGLAGIHVVLSLKLFASLRLEDVEKDKTALVGGMEHVASSTKTTATMTIATIANKTTRSNKRQQQLLLRPQNGSSIQQQQQQQQQQQEEQTTALNELEKNAIKPAKFSHQQPQEPPPATLEAIHWTALDDWKVVWENATHAPYTDMAPHLNVVWSRGWYNAVPLPPSVPMKYYNTKGRSDGATPPKELRQYFLPTLVCETGYLWVRGMDVSWFVVHILPLMNCNITIITGDCAKDAPSALKGGNALLESPKIQAWYAQDQSEIHDKMHGIPLGIPIHYGFHGSPNSEHTVTTMWQIRNSSVALSKRKRSIIYDPGTMKKGASDRRSQHRTEAYQILSKCRQDGGRNNNTIEIMTSRPPQEFWKTLASHQFGIAVTGIGWDTFRIWELLFFGTIPIIKSNPLDYMLTEARVPVWIVQDWNQVCDMVHDDKIYDDMLQKYKDWVKNAHYWMQPNFWIPRNQTKMDQLCDMSPGCRQVMQERMSRQVYQS